MLLYYKPKDFIYVFLFCKLGGDVKCSTEEWEGAKHRQHSWQHLDKDEKSENSVVFKFEIR